MLKKSSLTSGIVKGFLINAIDFPDVFLMLVWTILCQQLIVPRNWFKGNLTVRKCGLKCSLFQNESNQNPHANSSLENNEYCLIAEKLDYLIGTLTVAEKKKIQ